MVVDKELAQTEYRSTQYVGLCDQIAWERASSFAVFLTLKVKLFRYIISRHSSIISGTKSLTHVLANQESVRSSSFLPPKRARIKAFSRKTLDIPIFYRSVLRAFSITSTNFDAAVMLGENVLVVPGFSPVTAELIVSIQFFQPQFRPRKRTITSHTRGEFLRRVGDSSMSALSNGQL